MSDEIYAFPALVDWRAEKGMTLRDYFAAHAMTARISTLGGLYDVDHIAAQSYDLADAMLAAREA